MVRHGDLAPISQDDPLQEAAIVLPVIRQQRRAALPMMVVGLLRFWSLVQYGPRQRFWLAMCSHDQEKGDMPRVSGAGVSSL